MLRCALAAIALAVSAATVPAPAARARLAHYSLVRLWRAHLVPSEGRGVVHRLAVCPDGTSYLAHSGGEIFRIGADGRASVGWREAGLVGLRALACDERGRLHHAIARSWLVVSRVEAIGSLRVVRRVRVGYPILRVAPGWPVAYVLVDATRPGAFAHRPAEVSYPSGRIRLFDPVPRRPRSDLFLSATDTSAALVLNPRTGDLIHVPAIPYELHVYRADGSLARRLRREDVEPRRRLMPIVDLPATSRDLVLDAVALSSGRIVTHVRPQRGGRGRSFLEVFDENLHLVATEISTSDQESFGVLQGAAADESLYFLNVTPTRGAYVVRAVLRAQD